MKKKIIFIFTLFGNVFAGEFFGINFSSVQNVFPGNTPPSPGLTQIQNAVMSQSAVIWIMAVIFVASGAFMLFGNNSEAMLKVTAKMVVVLSLVALLYAFIGS